MNIFNPVNELLFGIILLCIHAIWMLASRMWNGKDDK